MHFSRTGIKIEAGIFDLDGVISDSQKIHSRLDSMLFERHGLHITPEELTRRFSGVSMREACPIIFGEAGLPCPDVAAISKEKFRLFPEYAAQVEEIDGARNLIEFWYPRIPLAVASGSRLFAIEHILKILDLRHRFKAIASSEEVENGKPAPDVFLLTARRLDVEPPKCVVIEDGIAGMKGARAAQMSCVALVQDMRGDFPADIIISHLKHFPHNCFYC